MLPKAMLLFVDTKHFVRIYSKPSFITTFVVVDAKYESRSTMPFYIPRDECFDRIKNSDFKATGLLSLVSSAVPKAGVLLTGKSEFESVEEIKTLFAPKGKDIGGLNNVLPTKADVPECDQDPLIFLNEVLKPNGQAVNPLVYPLPRILQGTMQRGWGERGKKKKRERKRTLTLNVFVNTNMNYRVIFLRLLLSRLNSKNVAILILLKKSLHSSYCCVCVYCLFSL
jgi:hypothetical protein